VDKGALRAVPTGGAKGGYATLCPPADAEHVRRRRPDVDTISLIKESAKQGRQPGPAERKIVSPRRGRRRRGLARLTGRTRLAEWIAEAIVIGGDHGTAAKILVEDVLHLRRVVDGGADIRLGHALHPQRLRGQVSHR
jgi:hypothetical protein